MPLVDLYLHTKFHSHRKTFVDGWTDAYKDGWTENEAGYISSTWSQRNRLILGQG